MSTNIILAFIVLLGLAAIVVLKSKANLGQVVADFFGKKQVLLFEVLAFILVPLHAHIAAELGVKLTGGIYAHRFVLHFTLEFIPFAIGMGLYRNGKELAESFSKGFGSIVKEFFDVVALLLLNAAGLWLSLYQMSVGFGKPYMAFLKNSRGQDVTFSQAFISLTDFQLSTSYVIVFAHGLVFLGLLFKGITSNIDTSQQKGKGGNGGLFGSLADLFGSKKAAPTAVPLENRIAKILGNGSPGQIRTEMQGKETRLKTLCDRYDSATTPFEKQQIAREIEDFL